MWTPLSEALRLSHIRRSLQLDQQIMTTKEEAATTPDALPRGGLRLLGTMGLGSAPQALLLLGNSVVKVAPGDRAGGAQVRAIEPGRVVLDVRGSARTLRVPG
ncbi:MAG: hypothetical protein AAF714_04890 [Pseudomonadota bacterium]